VWAEWELGESVTQDVLGAIARAWPQDDEPFCSSVSDQDPRVVVLSFDVDASDEDEAFARARSSVEAMMQLLGVQGRLGPLQGYTDTHHFTELPPGPADPGR